MKTNATALRLFHVTYDVVTPESSVNGDTADNGYLNASGVEHSVTGLWGAAVKPVAAECAMSLKEAVNLCSPQEDAGRWFSETDGSTDYSTGTETRKALHPPRNISAASYSRLRKALGV